MRRAPWKCVLALLAATALASFAPAPASGAIVEMRAHLDAEQAGTDSPATGDARVTVDTDANTLSYVLTYQNLTSPELGAHIHGPAPRNQLSIILQHHMALGTPKTGVWQYDESLEHDVLAGLFYFNIHTSAWNAGEIRGQIEPAFPGASPTIVALLALALAAAGATLIARRRIGRRPIG